MDPVEPPAPFTSPASGACVLVVEPDAGYRELLTQWLRKWDYEITAARDGAEAWDLLQRDPTPRLVVLDECLPAEGEPELCRRIRSTEQTRASYVLLLTRRRDLADAIAGLQAGAKPLEPEQLRLRLRVGRRILSLQKELIAAREALDFHATHDPLTRTWNRSAIQEILRRELLRAQRTATPLGILVLDVDRFDDLHCAHGAASDAVAQEVSRRVVSSLRVYDWVGRSGPAEFLIIVPGCSPPDVWRIAQRLRARISDVPVHLEETRIAITASVGVAAWNAAKGSPLDQAALLCATQDAL